MAFSPVPRFNYTLFDNKREIVTVVIDLSTVSPLSIYLLNNSSSISKVVTKSKKKGVWTRVLKGRKKKNCLRK